MNQLLTQTPITPKTGENFSAADFGLFSQLQKFVFTVPGNPLGWEGKVFLKESLNLTSAEISLNNLSPGKAIPFLHQHELNEEIYIFVRGKGEFQVDECIFAVSEGTVVRVDPQGERCLRNTSEDEELCFIVIQSQVNSHRGQTIEDGCGVQYQVNWIGKKRI